MLIRISGGVDGIRDYLENGQKQGREFSRDDLDERVILAGDLETTDTIIQQMDNEGDRYLHITLAFKEDEIDREKLAALTREFENFAFAAYEPDEYSFYAEAHMPRVKSYTNKQTGEFVERKPHIHIVIPKKNLLSEQHLNPFGVVEHNEKFIDAFQEHINNKFGLASPKENRRLEFTGESEMISRYKGDAFTGNNKDLKGQILEAMLARKIESYDGFKAMLAEYGDTRTRNAGKPSEYENVKKAGQAKGVNLKEHVFSREFVELPDAEKRKRLATDVQRTYETAGPPRKTPHELDATLNEWRQVRAKEVKYLNSGNRKAYQEYKESDQDGRRRILADREARFYTKHRQGKTHEQQRPNDPGRREFGRSYGFKRSPGQEHTQAASARNRQRGLVPAPQGTPPQSINRVRSLSSVGVVRLSQGGEMLLQGDALNHLEHGGTQRADQLRRPGAGERGLKPTGREADSVPSQLARDQRESKQGRSTDSQNEFKEIKTNLDASRLLAELSQSHGVIPDKYQVTKSRDGGDRIKAGTRNLNVSDFLTREMNISWQDAAEILRNSYARQCAREPAQETKRAPRRELWEAFRKAQPDQAKQKAQEWDAQRQSEKERRAAIRDDYHAERRAIQNNPSTTAERKAALSIARMERVTKDMALREAVSEERRQLKERHSQSQPYQERYRAFLAERANKGDENALAELRRQRDTSPAPTGPNTIEGASHRDEDEEDKAAHLARALSYSIDRAGNVTYYADQAKRRALVIDSGQRVTVAAAKDSQAVETGLRLAVQKFGPGLRIEGSDEFKRQVIEAALKTGLRVEFDSKAMNDELTRRRAERDDLQARGKAFIASEREKAEQAKAPKEPATPAPEKTREPERTPQPEPERRKPRGYAR